TRLHPGVCGQAFLNPIWLGLDNKGMRRWVCLRAYLFRDQRCILSDASRPSRRGWGGHFNVGSSCSGKPCANGGMGAYCCHGSCDRLFTGFNRPRRGATRARALYLASLSQACGGLTFGEEGSAHAGNIRYNSRKANQRLLSAAYESRDLLGMRTAVIL